MTMILRESGRLARNQAANRGGGTSGRMERVGANWLIENHLETSGAVTRAGPANTMAKIKEACPVGQEGHGQEDCA